MTAKKGSKNEIWNSLFATMPCRYGHIPYHCTNKAKRMDNPLNTHRTKTAIQGFLTKLSVMVLVFGMASCTETEKPTDTTASTFTQELSALQDYFQIPGLAISIEKDGALIYERYMGVADRETGTPVNENTLFPIASITKVFSGVLVMKLAAQNKLSLDDPINTYLPESGLHDSILVKHVLSHTSQGRIGEEFYYSSRFGALTKVIELAAGTSFSEVMEQEILTPLQLQQTFLLQDSTQIENLAKPYVLDNGIENGFVDYGYSASAGIVSNLKDLALFNRALDNDQIIDKASKARMFTSYRPELPYGYGIFNQQFENLDIVWAYGQYDCYSSLLLKIPAKGLTLTLLANNSLMSDPARLINGEVTSSLFAMSFLKNYVFELTETPLFEKRDAFSEPLANSKLYRQKIMAEALAASYMARYDPEQMITSAALIEHLLSTYPEYLEYADLNLLHTLAFLKDVAFYMDLGEFNDFDIPLENIGNKLLETTPYNPYVHTYLGNFYARKGENNKARYHFEHIVNAPNFSSNWYTKEAQQWLNTNKE